MLSLRYPSFIFILNYISVIIYLFKVRIEVLEKGEIYSKSTTKTPEQPE